MRARARVCVCVCVRACERKLKVRETVVWWIPNLSTRYCTSKARCKHTWPKKKNSIACVLAFISCEVSKCGEASAVSVEGDRFAILIVVQAMWSEWMWGSQCSVSERLVVWWSTGAADWFRQAEVSFRITLHACHDCTDANSKFQFRRQPFHTFQRSTKTHRQFLLVFAACSAASGTSLWASRPQEQSGHPQWFLTSPRDPRSSLVIGSEIDVSSILFRELVLPLVPLTATVMFNFERVFLSSGSRGKERKKNHTSKSCSFVVFVESNCKLKRSRWGILLNTEKGQTWQQQCQHALWTFTWQGRTPIRLSRTSSHDVTMTTCIRAIGEGRLRG